MTFIKFNEKENMENLENFLFRIMHSKNFFNKNLIDFVDSYYHRLIRECSEFFSTVMFRNLSRVQELLNLWLAGIILKKLENIKHVNVSFIYLKLGYCSHILALEKLWKNNDFVNRPIKRL
ncbi:hypothetical protein BpHYR1_032387 [Brachionus plicatilis]|uniref:Uncharacterized protein n=1 Tax=Brachionus plicatilis TaxID=10195 RepID=A0A3M7PFD4_BRAPC|nr:hypothetical protein BpHYR1_032387 [Brachionus plicatilis]